MTRLQETLYQRKRRVQSYSVKTVTLRMYAQKMLSKELHLII